MMIVMMNTKEKERERIKKNASVFIFPTSYRLNDER